MMTDRRRITPASMTTPSREIPNETESPGGTCRDGASGPNGLNRGEIKDLLLRHDPAFRERLGQHTERRTAFDELIFLSSMRRKAIARGLPRPGNKAGERPLRLAILG